MSQICGLISIIGKSDNYCNMPLDMINEILMLEQSCQISDHLKPFKKVFILIDQDWQELELARCQ